MYRKLILGILLLVSSSATYYVVFSGGSNVITGAIKNDVTPSYNTPTVDMLSGIYTCDKSSGCLGPITLTLKDDNTVEMVTPLNLINNEGKEVSVDMSAPQTVDEKTETVTVTEANESTGDFLLGDSSDDDGFLLERGSWDIGTNNILIVSLTETGTSTYDRYHKFIAQKVSTSTIQKISFPKEFFPGFNKPSFMRQEY